MKQQLIGAMIATILCATGAGASVLPQIRSAEGLTASGLSQGEALRKHYVEIEAGVYQAVKGARERRQIRIARWRSMLSGDRALVYATEGHPVFRHRESSGGISREFWSYPDQRWTYVFEGDRLISTTRF